VDGPPAETGSLFLYPFQGISPVLLVVAAMVFLKERADWRTWTGVGLITAGTVLVAFSLPASGGDLP